MITKNSLQYKAA